MKRIIALLLACISVLTLAACGGNLEEVGTQTETVTAAGTQEKETATDEEVKQTEEKEKVKTDVAEPLTWEKINAIPVAKEGMSERELRQICLDFMELQLTFPWTPNETVHIRIKDHMKGSVYGGMPYVSSTFNNLYQLMMYYDEENGMMDVKSMGKNVEKIMGNQCSANSFWAWTRVSDIVSWGGTSNITESRGAIYRGDQVRSYMQTNHKDLVNFNELSTVEICSKIGKQGVYQGYAQLLAADGLAYNKKGSGHVMMVYEDAVVKYENGKISDDSYIVVQHQTTGAWVPSTQTNGEAIELAPGYRSTYTFEKMYEGGYLPFTIPELCGQDPVEETEMSFSITENEASISKLILAKVSSNYILSDITVSITDTCGTELFRKSHCSHSSEHFRAREMTLAAFGFRRDVYSTYAGKGNLIHIYVRTSKGDQTLVYSGTLAS